MSGIFLTYTWYGKWVDIFQVYVGIFQTYRPSGQIYGIFQEYVRISNFYGFQMDVPELVPASDSELNDETDWEPYCPQFQATMIIGLHTLLGVVGLLAQHLESCTPGPASGTRQYKMVCTGTNQYVP
jgi:hypothetical protein